MPLTSKGEEIKANMEQEYGKSKGERVFYASANKDTIKGVHNDRSNKMNNDGGPGSGPKPGSGGQAAYEGPMEPKGSKAKPERQAAYEGPMEPKGQKDQTQPDPATGSMSTKGPISGKVEGLPDAASPSSRANDCGREIGLDAIKDAGKRGGRY